MKSGKRGPLHETTLPKASAALLNGILILFFGTLAAGLVFRAQLAGWIVLDPGFELRRAHSHLGFYGVLFPVSWYLWNEKAKGLPNGWPLLLYFALAAASGIGFFIQGYGPFTIAASTGVLFVWLAIAIRNFSFDDVRRRSWLSVMPTAIFMASLLVGTVAVMNRRDPALASRLARTFLSLLLFGGILPAVISSLGGAAPRAGVWLLASLAAGISLTGAHSHPFFSIGLIALGGLILASFWRSPPHSNPLSSRACWHWRIFAVGLMATGASLLPHHHSAAIAGVHYLVLGPVILSFAAKIPGFRPSRIENLAYELSVIAMVATIGLQQEVPGAYLQLQKLSAVFGALVVASALFSALKGATRKRSRRRSSERSPLQPGRPSILGDPSIGA